MSLPTFQLIPTATNAAAPFCFGHAFKQGDVPAGSSVTAPFSDFQCTSKNAWPDGSLKFAILAGRASVTGTTPLVSQLSVGAAATGAAVAASSISAVATVDCGAFGSVTWSGADWATPFQTLVSGPKMSSFKYRKPVGSDAHLVAWLEVRVWAGGELEVLPWIENGYMLVAGPTNKSATYSFTLGGTQRFSMAIDLKHHQRTVLIDGTKLSHWLGADTGVTPFHDQTYLKATELVPSYAVSVPAYDINNVWETGTSNSHDYLRDTFTPLAAGNLKYDSDYMGGGGYQAPIGLIPTHDVAYVICTTQPKLLYGAVLRAAFCAGRYGIHYRDEATNLPVAFSKYPGLVIYDDTHIQNTGAGTSTTPATSGGGPISWDTAHSPSVGYTAYLISGWDYFKEEAQFATVANHYSTTFWIRGGGFNLDSDQYNSYPTYTGASGICTTTVQTRQSAWAFRTLTQALAITPDSGDPLQPEFKFVVEENCRYFHHIYVEQPNNPFGIVGGPDDYKDWGTDRRYIAPWQQDFISGVWGMALCLGLPISSAAATKMAAFYQWQAKSVVHRLGDSTGWPYQNAAPYEYASSPSLTPTYYDGAGPWYANAAAAYAATYSGFNANSTAPAINGNNLSIDSISYKSMWGQVHTAIAYAERHAVPGAAAARARMTSAPNYSALITGFMAAPVWGAVPSGQTTQSGGSTVTGPTAIFDVDPTGPNAIFDEFQGQGIPLSAVPTGGTNAVSPVRAVMDGTDSPQSEVLINYLSTPAGFAAGGETSYSAPVGGVTYQIVLDSVPLPQATDTIVATGGGSGGGTTPVVTGVSVTPQNSQIAGGGTINFDWVVSGTGAISQGATCTTDLGTIDATGQLVGPAATSANQTGHVTIKSTQDPTKQGTATFTVLAAGTAPQLASRNVNIQFGPQPSANLSDLSVAFYDETKPHLATVARYQSGTQTTDAQGRMQFTVQSTLPASGVGSIVVYGPNGLHYNGPCSVS